MCDSVGQAHVEVTLMVYDTLYIQSWEAQERDLSLVDHTYSLTDYSKCRRTCMQADHRQVSPSLPERWQIHSESKDKQNKIKVGSYSKIT